MNLGVDEMESHSPFLARMNGGTRQEELGTGSFIAGEDRTTSPPAGLFPAEKDHHA